MIRISQGIIDFFLEHGDWTVEIDDDFNPKAVACMDSWCCEIKENLISIFNWSDYTQTKFRIFIGDDSFWEFKVDYNTIYGDDIDHDDSWLHDFQYRRPEKLQKAINETRVIRKNLYHTLSEFLRISKGYMSS